jgi:superfamily II DNA helicase RecQ
MKFDKKSIDIYHSKNKQIEKERILKNWNDNTLKIIIATRAFRKGIATKGAKFIIFDQLPISMDALLS